MSTLRVVAALACLSALMPVLEARGNPLADALVWKAVSDEDVRANPRAVPMSRPTRIPSGPPTDLASWRAAMNRMLAQTKRYPESLKQEAQREGRSPPAGRVAVAFVLDRTGRVLSVEVGRGSGIREFDEAAIAMVREAAPLPPPPPEVGGDTVRVEVSVVFKG